MAAVAAFMGLPGEGRMGSPSCARLGRVLSPPDSTGRNSRQANNTSTIAEPLVDLRIRSNLGAMLLCALVVLLCGCTSSSAASDQVISPDPMGGSNPVSYTHLRAHETDSYLV